MMCDADEDIRQAIYIILMTRKNERAMLPDFGCNLHEYVFELPDATAMELLRSEVMSALIQWEPRIVDTEVNIDLDGLPDGKVVLDIRYTARATNNPGNLVFPYFLYEGVGLE